MNIYKTYFKINARNAMKAVEIALDVVAPNYIFDRANASHYAENDEFKMEKFNLDDFFLKEEKDDVGYSKGYEIELVRVGYQNNENDYKSSEVDVDYYISDIYKTTPFLNPIYEDESYPYFYKTKIEANQTNEDEIFITSKDEYSFETFFVFNEKQKKEIAEVLKDLDDWDCFWVNPKMNDTTNLNNNEYSEFNPRIPLFLLNEKTLSIIKNDDAPQSFKEDKNDAINTFLMQLVKDKLDKTLVIPKKMLKKQI